MATKKKTTKAKAQEPTLICDDIYGIDENPGIGTQFPASHLERLRYLIREEVAGETARFLHKFDRIGREMLGSHNQYIAQLEGLDPYNEMHRMKLAAYVRSLPSRLGIVGTVIDANFAADAIEARKDRFPKCHKCSECESGVLDREP